MKSVGVRAASLRCFLFAVVMLAGSVQAATFTVINTNDSGSGSLRQAILAANGAAGSDTIVFAIPAVGLQTIAPATNLPIITEALIIDGYSQAGSSANNLALGDNAVLLIELNGSAVSNGTGLSFSGAVNGGEVKGLLMTKWNQAITLDGADNMTVDGNFFGTNAAGTAATTSTKNGNAFFILNSATGNTIGGAAAAARNLISGGNLSGIDMGNTGTSNNTIQNNYIGTNAAGTAAIPNLIGIEFNSPVNDTIRGNVISGNTGSTISCGILIENLASTILVVGNKIGTTADGTASLPNTYGVIVSDGFSGGASSNVIGTVGEPNIIAFNTKAGVAMKAGLSNASRQNAIRYNSIFSNGGLGIDLGDDGITPNDSGDGDVGLFNDLQNFPVISSAQFGGGTVTIAGSLSSQPSQTYAVQFFQSLACDSSGAGEGQTYLGEATINTDASGLATFNVTFPGVAGGFATATATDVQGNTSEFSGCAAVTTPATPSITISDAQVIEGNAGSTTMTFNVFLSAASALPVTVNAATANGSATSGSDYTATSGTVTFNPGETTKPFNVTIAGDATAEADETLLVNLTSPSNATIADNQGVGTIRNDDALSALTINDVTLNEGNSGTTSFDFTVTLTPASAFPVTVNYATADSTAVSGSDYQPASGSLTFTAGQTTKTVSVLVTGDVTTESNETFFVNLFNPGNASITDVQGLGTITNDDAIPTVTINDPSVVEGNSGTKTINFVITLSNPSSSVISVPFSLADGTANVGSDYQTNSGSFTVIPGSLTASLGIGVTGDTNVEPDETFFVNLGSATGATVVDNQGVGTIINDDGLPSPGISVSDVAVTEGNSGTTNANFTVQLTASSASTITVNYATADNTATTANNDYVAKSGTVTFTPGQTSQTVAVVVNGDTVLEPNETFFVNLNTPANGTIIKSQGTGTINNDDVAGSADLAFSKTGPATASTSANVSYIITVTNNGPTGASNVLVTDILPAGTTFVSSAPSQGSCAGTTTVSCSLGSLTNGGSATITLTIQMPVSPGTVSNTASVTASENDPTPGNNASTANTVVSPAIAPAPALSTWMLLMLAAMLSGLALMRQR